MNLAKHRFFLMPLLFAINSALSSHVIAAASSASAAIRVACSGEADGAIVEINGKKKGQCPVDIQIAPGDMKLKVYLKVDASHERAFFANFFMAENTMKKIDVKLGPPLNRVDMIEYARTAPDRARAAAMAMEEAQAKDAALESAKKEERERLENSWRKVTAEWGDRETDHGEGCVRLKDHMQRYIKQERHFRCSCTDETSAHIAHIGSVFTTCKATFEANLVMNNVSFFGKKWDGPHRGDGTGEYFKYE